MSNAARLGDLHSCPCPVHLGGPVCPLSEPNVIIDGSPAARKGDRLHCNVECDAIQSAEESVVICGIPCARVGDSTIHGGAITTGCNSVVVGKSTAERKRERLEQRRMLIQAGRERAAQMSDGVERERLLHACDRLEDNNVAVEYARLNVAIYDDHGAPDGWRRLTGSELPIEIRNSRLYNSDTGLIEDQSTGFHAAVFQSDVDGRYVLAYRGTEFTHPSDWAFGNVQNLGFDAPQYRQAHELMAVASQSPNLAGCLTTTGHSLGGGMSMAAALSFNIHAYVFNSAPLHAPDIVYTSGAPRHSGLIRSYAVAGEVLGPLRTLQDPPWFGGATTIYRSLAPIESIPANPSYVSHPPSVRVPWQDGDFIGAYGDGTPIFDRNENPFTRYLRVLVDKVRYAARGVIDSMDSSIEEVSSDAFSAFNKHKMAQVVEAIEKEKTSDVSAIEESVGK